MTTLAAMPGMRRRTSMLLAAAAVAALAGCGSDEGGGEIPQDQGNALIDQLDQVESDVQEGNCDGASDTASQVVTALGDLPSSAFEDADARTQVLAAGTKLTELVDEQCEPDSGATGETGELETTTSTSTTEPTTTSTTTEEPPEEEETTPPDDTSEDKPSNGPPATPPGQTQNQGGNASTGSGGIGSDE